MGCVNCGTMAPKFCNNCHACKTASVSDSPGFALLGGIARQRQEEIINGVNGKVDAYRAELMAKLETNTKQCEYCGEWFFEERTGRARFCKASHRASWHQKNKAKKAT